MRTTKRPASERWRTRANFIHIARKRSQSIGHRKTVAFRYTHVSTKFAQISPNSQPATDSISQKGSHSHSHSQPAHTHTQSPRASLCVDSDSACTPMLLFVGLRERPESIHCASYCCSSHESRKLVSSRLASQLRWLALVNSHARRSVHLRR